jgi:hypothetical protein
MPNKPFLSEHFSYDEATFSSTGTRLNLANSPDNWVLEHMRLAAVGMEQVRRLLGRSIHIDSWYRSLLVNRAVGSADTSGHVLGWCIDFVCPAYGSPLQICNKIIEGGIAFDQLIWEGKWVHISFDPRMRGEVLTAIFKPGEKTKYVKGLRDGKT